MNNEMTPHQDTPKTTPQPNSSSNSPKSKSKGQGNFKCETCGRAFLFKNNLKAHQRTHTRDKKYTCDQCQKSFIYKESLKNHMLLHSNELPYSCEICQKKFRDRSNRRKHVKNVHKVLPTSTSTSGSDVIKKSKGRGRRKKDEDDKNTEASFTSTTPPYRSTPHYSGSYSNTHDYSNYSLPVPPTTTYSSIYPGNNQYDLKPDIGPDNYPYYQQESSSNIYDPQANEQGASGWSFQGSLQHPVNYSQSMHSEVVGFPPVVSQQLEEQHNIQGNITQQQDTSSSASNLFRDLSQFEYHY